MPEISDSLRARRKAAFARNYMVLTGTCFQAGYYQDFIRCAIRSVTMDVQQLRYLAAFPARLAARLRARLLSATA